MESFIKISLSAWAVEMTQTHAHTHIHTHSQTDTLGSIATCSVKLTEYKQDSSRRCQYIQSIDPFITENTNLIDKTLSNSLSTGPS